MLTNFLKKTKKQKTKRQIQTCIPMPNILIVWERISISKAAENSKCHKSQLLDTALRCINRSHYYQNWRGHPIPHPSIISLCDMFHRKHTDLPPLSFLMFWKRDVQEGYLLIYVNTNSTFVKPISINRLPPTIFFKLPKPLLYLSP